MLLPGMKTAETYKRVKDINYAHSLRRLYWLTFVIGTTATLLAFPLWGSSAGGGIALGSLASFANLWIWERIALGISGSVDGKTKAAGVLFGGRFLALFAFGYVIVKTLSVDPFATLLGLFASSVAAVAEILIQLFSGWRLTR